MEHPTIQVNATGEKVQVNGEIIRLTDKTCSTFSTTAIMAFIAFITFKKQNVECFVDTKGVEAFIKKAADFFTKPFATFSYKIHPIVQVLKNANGHKMDSAGFEKFIRLMRSFMTGEGAVQLRDFSTNMNIQKVKTITRQKDHQGNYSYGVVSEAGKNDFAAPKSVLFKIPLVADIPESYEFEMDFFISITETESGPKVDFEFNRPLLDYEIDQTILGSVQKAIQAAGFDAYLGSNKIYSETDERLMKNNPVIIKNNG